MADTQSQAVTTLEPKAPEASKSENNKKQRREPSRLTWWWRFFWMRRSGARTVWALILAMPALLAAIYLALPQSDQAQVVVAIQAAGQALGPTGLRVAVEVTLVVCTLVSLSLLISPGYRQYRYLTIPTSIIPPVSVYVDAENSLRVDDVPALVQRLRKALGGHRADLLYFMDASQDSSSGLYKTLYKHGFRLVDVPHNPTDTKIMFEAVDREIAMHALERALLGPSHQEFIIVSSDADYATLVFRLVALGHTVQVWSAHQSTTYNAVKDDLTVFPDERFTPLALSSELDVSPGAPHPAEVMDATRRRNRKPGFWARNKSPRAQQSGRAHPRPLTWSEPYIEPPESLTSVQGRLYVAIAATLSARHHCEIGYEESERNSAFINLLGEKLQPRLASIGYQSGSKVEFWRAHMGGIGVLTPGANSVFPAQGATTPTDAARRFYAMVAAVADAAAHATSTRGDGVISAHNILSRLEGERQALASLPALAQLASIDNGQRSTHIRYLTNCARAVGILQFDDVATSLDLFSNPRLTPPQKPGDGAPEH